MPMLKRAKTTGPRLGIEHPLGARHPGQQAGHGADGDDGGEQQLAGPSTAGDREPITAATIDMATMKVTEKWAPSRSQSLKLMPPHDFRMTATQKTGRAKKTNVKNVTR